MRGAARLRIDLSHRSDRLCPDEAFLFEGDDVADGRIFYPIEEEPGGGTAAEDRKMKIHVRQFGYLKERRVHGVRKPEEMELSLPEDSTIKDLLKMLDIPEKELFLVVNPGEKERVFIISDEKDASKTFELMKNDRVWIYPFLDGG